MVSPRVITIVSFGGLSSAYSGVANATMYKSLNPSISTERQFRLGFSPPGDSTPLHFRRAQNTDSQVLTPKLRSSLAKDPVVDRCCLDIISIGGGVQCTGILKKVRQQPPSWPSG